MSDHYYSEKQLSLHDRQIIEVTLRGQKMRFMTDAGVFSKRGIDFGSRLLIETMRIPFNGKILDVGCGYGPIGLAAAWLASSGEVMMIDINERAIELAAYNAQLNRIGNVRLLQSNLFEEVTERDFTTILTNPPIRAGKEVVHRIFSESADRLVPGGELWVVIQKKQGAPSALAKLESLFANVVEEIKDKGYRIYRATK